MTWLQQSKEISAITLFVQSVAVSKAFYATAFDAVVYYEDDVSVVFKFGSTLINLLQEGQAYELISPAKVADASTGSRMQFTITVDDVDSVCAELASRGVALLNGPIDRPWGIRTAAFSDPDGHVWELAH